MFVVLIEHSGWGRCTYEMLRFLIHVLLLSLVPLNQINFNKDKNLKEERELSNLMEDVRFGLEKSIEKRTREVKDLLDKFGAIPDVVLMCDTSCVAHASCRVWRLFHSNHEPN